MGGFLSSIRRSVFPTDEEISFDNQTEIDAVSANPEAYDEYSNSPWNRPFDAYSDAVQGLPGPHPDSPVGQFGAAIGPEKVAAGIGSLGGPISSLVSNPADQPMPTFPDVAGGTSWKDQGPSMPAEAAAPAQGQPARSNPIQAIRTPDGRIVFTNVGGYAGQDVDPSEAAGAQRQAAAVGTDPTGRVMKSMIQSAARSGRPVSHLGGAATMLEARRSGGQPPEPIMAGNMQEGEPWDETPSSQMRGSPQMEFDLAMEDAGRSIGMETAASELERAEMPLQEQARLGNPDIQMGEYITEKFGPQLEKAQSTTADAIQLISDPSSPRFIPDEKMRAQKIRELKSNYESKRMGIDALMSTIVRQRIPQQ